MMKHPASSISKSSLTGYEPQDIQPNAIDVRVEQIQTISSNEFSIDDDNKTHRGSEPVEVDDSGYFVLPPGSYEIVMQGLVHMGEGEAGYIITRSTLNRNGVYITSGLYDSGYHGVMAATLHVTSGIAKIKKGTAVGQFILMMSESIGMYDGDYGVGKEHDKKYNVTTSYDHEPIIDDPNDMYYYANGKRYEFINGELVEKQEQLELGFEVVEDSNPRFHLASGAGYEEYHPDKAKEKDAAIKRTKYIEGHNS